MIKIPPPPISPQSMADLLCTLIILCKGIDKKDKPIWAYLCLKPSMAKSFKEARERGDFDVADYGSVIESGEGDEPDSDTQKRMERDYGVNHRFEEQLLDAAAAIRDKQTA